MYWVSLVLIGVQLVTLAWMSREMYRNGYGRARWGAGILVLVITIQQVVEVTIDPSRTSEWVALGVGVICSLFAGIGLLRSRRPATVP